MILIDLNQTLISSFMAHIGSNPKAEISEKLVRHIVLTTILNFKKRFGETYGEIVLCDDSTNYWRKDFHPYYKGARKKQRKESPFDWALIFNNLKKIKDELREHFPYRLIQIERAEADDIIAALCEEWSTSHPEEKILILSNDHDFLQLQKYSNVSQYSPMQKRFLKTNNPKKHILEKILKGDAGDGVPNILSDDDTFMVDHKRQKPLRQNKIDLWLSDAEEFKKFLSEDKIYQENFNRNMKVINLDYIPLEIKKDIIKEYHSQNPQKRGFMNYFIKNNLRILAESANEF
jgi:5'-3' exonuclease